MANGLYIGVQECRFKQLQFLVESGLSVNQKNSDDQHTLVAALQIQDDVKRNRMIKYLLKHKADCRAFDSRTGRDVFLWACFLGRTAEAQLILHQIEDDFDFQKKDTYGRTALHYATMRGNTDLLSFICKKMAKYELTVDVRDSEGFTPFLIAKRLGFEECAEVLLKVGMASPYQFDHKERKMGHDWEQEGMKEHFSNLSHSNKKRVSMYKALGRLPALKRASFDSTKVNVVASKKDKRFLSKVDKYEDPLSHRDISDFSRLASKNPKRSSSLNDLTSIDNEKEISFSLQIPRDLMARSLTPPSSATFVKPKIDSSLNVASTDEALRLINMNTPLATDDTESNYSSPPETYRSSIAESIPEFMHILEEQSSHAFRPKAKKPKDVVPIQPRPNTRSTMAIIFGKDGSKKVLKKEVPQTTMRKNQRLASIKEVT